MVGILLSAMGMVLSLPLRLEEVRTNPPLSLRSVVARIVSAVVVVPSDIAAVLV
jgi:hypothetical protein